MEQRCSRVTSRIPSRDADLPVSDMPRRNPRSLRKAGRERGTRRPGVKAHAAPFNSLLLLAYSAIYVLPLAWVRDGQYLLSVLGTGLLVAAVGIAVAVLTSPRKDEGRRPSPTELAWMGATSGLELIAAVAGLLLGLFLDLWWLLGAFLMSSVALHFAALTRAFRRTIDFVLLPVVVVAAAIAWVLPLASLVDNWALAGALASASCLSYAVVLTRSMPGGA